MSEFTCKYCHEKFTTNNQLKNHFQAKHRTSVVVQHMESGKLNNSLEISEYESFLDVKKEYKINEDRTMECGCGDIYKDIKCFKKHCLECTGCPVIEEGRSYTYTLPISEGNNDYESIMNLCK
jgi:hypothetical protein